MAQTRPSTPASPTASARPQSPAAWPRPDVPQHVAVPAYGPVGRALAVTGFALYVPTLVLLFLTVVGLELQRVNCSDHECTPSLVEAIRWSWPVIGAAGVTSVIAILLPNRLPATRCVVACLQLALMITPFILLFNA
ncbi:hypothetical protein AB0K89_22970 [Streptomyces cinnamoneus]|uniref:hypothetical protein n=1 Tax=Streptomyces cinnamoneus TaxID=53446 RepID=UPI00344037B9